MKTGHKIEMEAEGMKITKTVKLTPERRRELGLDDDKPETE